MTKGRYGVSGNVPFGIGIEGVGEIVEVGEKVENLQIGATVAYMHSGRSAYAEYLGLGCDRIINYKKEDLGEVLAKEYPVKLLDKYL
ncbi:hypothetical protein TNCV_3473641 [Trichonephila clavipes]|nr:hypothetical protein TNCV_3473641 [Trichonephila clavipes]